MRKLRWQIAQKSEHFWWKNFTKKKNTEEYLQHKKEYWRDFLQKLEVDPASTREPMIDIGCGPAGIFTIFDAKDILALDPLLPCYERDLDIFDKQRYPKVEFASLAFEEFLPTRQYNTVFCLNAVNHFHQLSESIEKIAKLTAPGGQLIFSIDCHNHALLKPLYRSLQFDILHPHQYDLEEYCQMLKTAGFRIGKTHRFIKRFTFDYIGLTAIKT